MHGQRGMLLGFAQSPERNELKDRSDLLGRFGCQVAIEVRGANTPPGAMQFT
jgi:hypothetical protein